SDRKPTDLDAFPRATANRAIEARRQRDPGTEGTGARRRVPPRDDRRTTGAADRRNPWAARSGVEGQEAGRRRPCTRARSSYGDLAGTCGRGTLRRRARPTVEPASPALPGATALALSSGLSRGTPEYGTGARDSGTTRRRFDRRGDRAQAAHGHGVR